MFGKYRNIHDYISSMKKLLNYKDRFDTVYPSHGEFPVDPELIVKLINGAELIENKKCQGNPIDMFGNKVMLYKFEYAGFLCES